MEIFLHLWDELDDLMGACRHIATCAAMEAAALSKPLLTAASGCIVSLLSLKIPF
jgi:hypothetical protein